MPAPGHDFYVVQGANNSEEVEAVSFSFFYLFIFETSFLCVIALVTQELTL